MQRLTSLQNIIYFLGGILLLLGTVLALFGRLTLTSAILFAVGAVAFTYGEYVQDYENQPLDIRRLHRQQLLGCVCWLFTAVLMFLWLFDLPPFYGDVWKLILTIGVVFYAYGTFRLSAKLKKK